jgi:5-oxoprolinase (ATP-hydrolysing)
MGRILQRTSISTNIKERLDFSCALFDHTGGLVSNAPHIPVRYSIMSYLYDTTWSSWEYLGSFGGYATYRQISDGGFKR